MDSGEHPMEPSRTLVDCDHVTTTASRYGPTGRRFGRDGTDAGEAPAPRPPMSTRTDHVERIHAQIAAGAYRVDPEAVAEAMIRRLLGPPDARDRPDERP
jgi:anti-sigma-28 factor FlgM